LIVDDHALVREGIRQALTVPGFEVVGEAGAGPEGLEKARQTKPHVVVLDISLPGESGIRTAARLRTEVPEVRVLMLSVHDHAEYVIESIKAGAHGYLRKDTLPDELRGAIRALGAGQTHFGGAIGTRLLAMAPVLPDAAADRIQLLTKREREVLFGIATGKSNKEMAGELKLSVRTVESYRESLIRKLGIPSVAGLTRFAMEAGIVPS
jgi:DNA-binding NarL/FixJ family response regulator